MPRLSIKHLLLWMTFSSMLASISHLKGYSPPMSVAYLLGSLINSGALTVTAVVLYTCIRQSRWNLLQPGHWFAFVATWGIIDGIAVMPLCVWLAPNYKGYIYCIAFIGMAAVYFVGAVTGSWKRYWKLALALLALDMVSATSWRLFQEWWGWPGTAEFIYTRIHPVLGTPSWPPLFPSVLIYIANITVIGYIGSGSHGSYLSGTA